MNKARLFLLGFGCSIMAVIGHFAVMSGSARSARFFTPKTGTDALAGPRLQSGGKLPLAFEVNQGQTEARIDFIAHARGYNFFVGSTEADFLIAQPVMGREKSRQAAGSQRAGSRLRRSAFVRMKLGNARPDAAKVALEQLPGKVSYFLGNDTSKWHMNLATYAKVKYQDVYPGIDLLYYGTEHELEYDFVVAPGADPGSIRLRFEGADRLQLDERGDLALHTSDGPVLQLHKPIIYQESSGMRREIAGGFKLAKGEVSFHLGAYDKSRPVIIDPVFSFSTHLGGSRSSSGQGIAVDGSGNIYVTGDTNAADFPTAKPAQRKHGGSTDVFVTKLSPDGSRILYSTFIGGSGDDVGYGIAVDAAGNAYITGDTSSTDFPVKNPEQKNLGGMFDAFALKLSADGSTLLYSTYIGGSQGDRGDAIAVDASGNAYITGFTYSTDFPVVKPIQTAFTDGNVHTFVTKLDATGSTLMYSTYLGGGDDRPDQATGIAVDSGGNAYVTGYTNSAKFPSVNAVQKFVGPTDVFVTKINPAGSAFVYSTHLGGNADDEGMAIAVDSSGSAYVAGETESLDFPTTPGAYSTKCTGVPTPGAMRQLCSGGDVFVSKLSPDGSKLVYSTYVNGTGFDVGRGIAVDPAGNAYVTGLTTSRDFPAVNPLQKGFGGGEFDAFVFKLNADGSALVYSSTLGGDQNDGGYAIAVDSKGNSYVTGYTYSRDFPTKNPLRNASGSANPAYRDVFVAKISDGGTTK